MDEPSKRAGILVMEMRKHADTDEKGRKISIRGKAVSLPRNARDWQSVADLRVPTRAQ